MLHSIMNNKAWSILVAGGVMLAGLSACKRTESGEQASPTPTSAHPTNDDGHAHDDGAETGHGDEISIGSATIGGLEVECWQGHGTIAPSKELHLVVKLPYSDSGATTIRAWIGTEDRLASIVAKAEYAASHDDYDVHCEAPSPLPENPMWWIEIEKPDGSKQQGSIAVR